MGTSGCNKKGRVYLIIVSGLILASWLPSADTINVPTLKTQTSCQHLPLQQTTVQLTLTSKLPSPTRPSLRIGVPRNIPATLLTLPKTHPGRGYRLVGELGSPAMWHSCLGVRQCYGGYLEDGNRLFVIFFCFIYGETLCRLIFLMGTLPHPYGTS